jgi:hypothetical protein
VVVTRRASIGVVCALAIALWYLRDPGWLIGQTTGLRPWQRESDGRLSRWSGGHASFFVPSDIRALRIPVATAFDARRPGGDGPMMVTFTIDDQRAARILLTDDNWQDVTLVLPPPGSRRVRRVDLRTSVTREGNRGVRLGEMMSTVNGEDWRPCCASAR